jgi:hypothetical protein
MLRLTRARSSVLRSTASPRRRTCSVPSRHCFGSLVHVQRWCEPVLRVAHKRAAVQREVSSGPPWACSGPARGCSRSPVDVQRSRERLLRVARARGKLGSVGSHLEHQLDDRDDARSLDALVTLLVDRIAQSAASRETTQAAPPSTSRKLGPHLESQPRQ